MFGRSKAAPTQTPAHAVAALAAEALLGTLQMDVSKGYALAKVFGKYKADVTAQADAVVDFANQLAAENPGLAARLVDALAEKVGR